MRETYLPDSDEFLTVEDALLLIGSSTTLDKFSYEENEWALHEAWWSGIFALQDECSMRDGNPSKNAEATRKRVAAKIGDSGLADFSAELWISLADVRRFAEMRFVLDEGQFRRDELLKHAYTIYDVENELGYTIRGAAMALSKKYGVLQDAMRDRIFEAAEQQTLQVRDPRTRLPYIPTERSDHYERISVKALNEWLEASGVPFHLGDTPEEAITAGSTGINRDEVMRAFPVRKTVEANKKFWDGRLSQPPIWLSKARVDRGKPGRSARWDPLLVAHALLDSRGKFMTLVQLDAAIGKNFPDLLDQWKDQTVDHRGRGVIWS